MRAFIFCGCWLPTACVFQMLAGRICENRYRSAGVRGNPDLLGGCIGNMGKRVCVCVSYSTWESPNEGC